MQDLLLAQKRDRPAYCFQHLDLELRSHGHARRANSAASSATLAPRYDVVACFEPEWNSLDVNKTRSLNILGGIRHALMHGFAAFAQAKSAGLEPCARRCEVSVMSGGRLCRQPLENQEIECRRFADKAGQQGVDLAPVVGLVIEPVG